MQIPLSLLDQTVLEEIPPSLWVRLFDAVGWPESLNAKRGTIRPPDIRHSLEVDALSAELLLALEALETLGTDAGRDAISAAVADQRLSADTLPSNLSARELALELFLRQREDAAIVEVFVRAQTQIEARADHRRYSDFLGTTARSITGLGAKAELLEAAVREYCRVNDMGDHVHVRAFNDDGTYVFQIIRSHSIAKPRAVLPGQPGRTTIVYRPVYADMLRYESAAGRLRVAARFSSMVEFYRRTLGTHCFGDADFFSGNAVYDLRGLQSVGQAALEKHDIPSVGRVRMTECLWQRGDRSSVHFRSTDCFRAFNELGLSTTEGEFVQVKLKIQVIGPSTRPVTVGIRPSGVEVNAKRHEGLVDEYLEAIGIRGAQNARAPSLWSLYPWRHPAYVWRFVFGAALDALVQRRALTPVQLESVPSPDRIASGNLLEAVPVESREYYGVSREPEVPSRSLSLTDLDGMELDPEQFGRYLIEHLGMTQSAISFVDNAVLDLGDMAIGNVLVKVAYAIRQPNAGIGDRLRARSGGAHLVMLTPANHDGDLDLPTTVLRPPFPSRDQVIRKIVAACGLSAVAPARYLARDGVRLVVDTQRQEIWVDNVLIADARPDTVEFRFIRAMVERGNEPVSHVALTQILSEARLTTDGTAVARRAKLEAKKAVVKSLSEAGCPFAEGDPFPPAGTGYYRCILPSQIV